MIKYIKNINIKIKYYMLRLYLCILLIGIYIKTKIIRINRYIKVKILYLLYKLPVHLVLKIDFILNPNFYFYSILDDNKKQFYLDYFKEKKQKNKE